MGERWRMPATWARPYVTQCGDCDLIRIFKKYFASFLFMFTPMFLEQSIQRTWSFYALMVKVVNGATNTISRSQLFIVQSFSVFLSDCASANVRVKLASGRTSYHGQVSFRKKMGKLCYKTNDKRHSCATIELWMHLRGLLSNRASITLLSCLSTYRCTLSAYHLLNFRF